MASKVRLGPSLVMTINEEENNANLIVKPALAEYMQKNDDVLYTAEAVRIATERLSKPSEDRSHRFGASSAGKCPRSQTISYLGGSGYGEQEGLRAIFDDGHWRHVHWQALLLSAGIVDDIEVWVRWPANRAGGQVDGHGVVADTHPSLKFRGKEFGLEIKGANTWAFKKMKGEGPKRYYQQVARYFLFTGWDLFVIFVEDKNTQETLEWVITENDVDMRQAMSNQFAELGMLNAHIHHKTLPDMLPACVKATGPDFKSCPYGKSIANTCHTLKDKGKQRDLFKDEQ